MNVAEASYPFFCIVNLRARRRVIYITNYNASTRANVDQCTYYLHTKQNSDEVR